MNRMTPVVKYLLIINGSMLALTYILKYFGIDLLQYLALFYFKSQYFEPFQFVTHMFMHANLIHLFFNMYALFIFGSVLETVWGPKRFFFYYIFTGLGAAALHTAVNWYMIHGFYEAAQHFIVNPDLSNFQFLVSHYSQYFNKEGVQQIIQNWDLQNINNLRQQINDAMEAQINVPTVGASGAVFGLLLAFGLMFPKVPLYLFFIPIPIRAVYFVIGYGALELFNGVTMKGGDHVAHFAHLGGMIFGYILLRIWYGRHINQQRT